MRGQTLKNTNPAAEVRLRKTKKKKLRLRPGVGEGVYERRRTK